MWQKINEHSDSQQQETLNWKYGQIQLSQQIPNLHSIMDSPNNFIITIPEIKSTYSIPDHPHLITIDCSLNEELKQWPTVDHLCELMLHHKINRESTIHIIGGGMLLDLAGFACSIFMRGVKKVVYMPTTLLAIVDATVGGKNGINWGQAKNMLGVTKHPDQIKICLNFLGTLTPREFSNGVAQIIKMSATHDLQLFRLLQTKSYEQLRTNSQILRQIVKKSLEIKVKVVEGDQFDRSSRKWLNFGHTVGHALELSRISQRIRHGQSVAIGMLKQLQIGLHIKAIKNKEVINRIHSLLKRYNLPTDIPEQLDSTFLIQQMLKDKKNSSNQIIQMTLIDQIGDRKLQTTKVSQEDLYDYFNQSITITNNQFCPIKATKALQSWNHRFPSSKSLSIRYLYLSALYYLLTKQEITITNFLDSDDTHCLKKSLRGLGFLIEENKDEKTIKIKGYEKCRKGNLDVGNSGLTARFILPLCAFLEGQWNIQCQKRMSERPNQQIVQYCLDNYQCEVQFLQKNYSFPMIVKSRGGMKPQQNTNTRKVKIESTKSSQFISSIMLGSCLNSQDCTVIETEGGILVSESYILLTISCLEYFGASVEIQRGNTKNIIKVKNFNNKSLNKVKVLEVEVQKDLSSLTYPYALSLIFDIKTPILPGMSYQGDLVFYNYCQSLKIQGQMQKSTKIRLDFNKCTDSFMTLAAVLATGKLNVPWNVQIFGIANQRVKESNRIELTRRNLAKIGYFIEETENGLIFPPRNPQVPLLGDTPQNIIFETSYDHRLAMSMGILSCWFSQQYPQSTFTIDNKYAVNKTFPEFWSYLSDFGIGLSSKKSTIDLNGLKYFIPNHKVEKLIITGNRGSGKTTLGQKYAELHNSILIDLDDEITSEIKKQKQLNSISEFVDKFGWDQFRKIETFCLKKTISEVSTKNLVICTGGGIIESEASRYFLSQYSETIPVIYLERDFDDLRIQITDKRPPLDDFLQRSINRQLEYEKIANFIINMPSLEGLEEANHFISEMQRIKNSKLMKDVEGGNILCIPKLGLIQNEGVCYNFRQDNLLALTQEEVDNLSGFQIRADLMLDRNNKNVTEKHKLMRKNLANFKIKNNKHLRNIPMILTLRTLEQYGYFEGDYYNQLKMVSKIPTDYLDIQISHQFSNQSGRNFYYHPNKLLYSYHGNKIQEINALMNKVNGNKKLCYFDGKQKFPQKTVSKWMQQTDICYNLGDPLSRIFNKFRMTILDRDQTKLIPIPSKKQIPLLQKIVKTTIKFRK